MKVLIPLAGFGTRLRPHTYTKPKPLVTVAGKPVLGHLLDSISGLDVSEHVFIVGYLGEMVQDYVSKHHKLTARYVEQKELLGQAHAIWLAREYLNDEPVFIIFVDTLFEADLSGLSTPGIDATIFVKEVEDPRRFGVVSLGGNGLVNRFVEKPATMENKLVVVGLYYFESGRPLLEAIEELMARKIMTKNEYFLADAMQLMIEHGLKFRTRDVAAWLDAGTPETVLATNHYLLDHGHDNSTQFMDYGNNTVVIPPVNIDPSAVIRDSVIGPHVSIGANCVIEGCVLRRTIIDAGSTCKYYLLEDSLIGRNTVVEGRFRNLNIGDSSVLRFA